MWNKPRELTNYPDNGFEIACGSSQLSSFVMTADYALKSWQESHFHNDVLLNNSIWKNHDWKAIGIGIYKGFAMVWFGDTVDAEGAPGRE